MNELKEYKELTTIQLFEWEIYTEASIEQLDKMLNSDSKFIRIGNEIIAKNQIKKCFVRAVDGIDNYILSLPKNIQDKLKTREKDKKVKVWRWFDSIEEIQNYLADKQLI